LLMSPDKNSRLEILKIHTKDMPLAEDVDIEELATMCEGYSGADLEALCREAAMLAVRKNLNAKIVEKKYFEEAMTSVRASITPDIVKFYAKLSEDLGSGVAKKDKKEKDIQYL